MHVSFISFLLCHQRFLINLDLKWFKCGQPNVSWALWVQLDNWVFHVTGNGTTKIILYFSWSKQGITVLHVPVVLLHVNKICSCTRVFSKRQGRKKFEISKKAWTQITVPLSFLYSPLSLLFLSATVSIQLAVSLCPSLSIRLKWCTWCSLSFCCWWVDCFWIIITDLITRKLHWFNSMIAV